MIEITPQQLVRRCSTLAHRLDYNVWNFEVHVGDMATEVYKNAFHDNIPKFPDKSAPVWPDIKRDRGRECENGYILYETGALCDSIDYVIDKNSGDSRIKMFTRGNEFFRHTRHPGYNFSRVHNEGAPEINIPQRQFFPTNDDKGLGSVVKDKIKEMFPQIFIGFPGNDNR